MWIVKTAAEIADEDRHGRRRQARWNLLIAALAYVVGCTLGTFGVRVVAPYEVVVSGLGRHSFTIRLVSAAIVMLPVAWVLHRFLPKGGRQELDWMTVCPACERRGARDSGQACACGGGEMRSLATVRWVE